VARGFVQPGFDEIAPSRRSPRPRRRDLTETSLLARMLLLLSNYGKEGKPIPVIPDITQEMLAEMIGTTRSRVSFFMNKFRKLGFISYNGTLEVHSSLLNVVLYD
jgi:CRP-like cAMP-binding protein